jgi:dienelactone hydrolase
VITNGSVQADEQLYWFVAQTLAKAGYVVLTSDPQGQGQSDELGEAPDQNEGSPAQSDGRPFFDGTTDAINFFLSSDGRPYEPVPSCETGTSHAAKQDRRVRAGLNTAYNPFWQMVDQSRLGIAGHSFGAAGVSYIGQADPRVKTLVAWDNLGSPDPSSGGRASAKPCPANPAARKPAPITKPALGMSADYFIPPVPNTSDPDPLAKSTQSREYSKAGVDTGELIIRGGTHYDFDWIPNPGFPATLRGADEIAWYTQAWFDKYVKGESSADSRLLTNRWHSDRAEAAVDPGHDGNMFSTYYRSRLGIHVAGGRRFLSEDMRSGRGLAPDCEPNPFNYIDVVTSPDRPRSSRPCPVGLAGSGHRCIPRRLAVSGRRIGPARLGRSYKAFFKRYRAVKRSRYATSFCVTRGGRFLVSARRGKIFFLATTARGHRTRRFGPGRRVPRGRIKGTRAIGRGLLVGHRVGAGRVIYGVRRKRTRFLAVTTRREAAHKRSLVRRLRAVGLLARRR